MKRKLSPFAYEVLRSFYFYFLSYLSERVFVKRAILLLCFLLASCISPTPQPPSPAQGTPPASPIPPIIGLTPPGETSPLKGIPLEEVSPPTPEELSTLELLAGTVVPERDLYDLATRLKKPSESIKRVVNDVPPHYQVGDRATFWVADQLHNTYFSITATLGYEMPHACFWVQDGLEVDAEALRKAAEDFEGRIYPANHRYFGHEWIPGVDNDPLTHILNARIPGLGGYYSSADEYSRLANPFSNEREMIYINIEVARPGTDRYNAILAHELQHAIHWNADRNEDTWVNEGLSELAMRLNGYDMAGAVLPFANSPDTQLNAWAEDPAEAGSHYAGSYLFMEYLVSLFGEGILRDVVATEANSVVGLDEVLAERGTSFEDTFADWVIANYLDDPKVADGRYDYPGLAVRASVEETHAHYPVERTGTVYQYAADYIELKPEEGDVIVAFSGATEAKLVANEPHSGRRYWWSNRGDSSDATLTRAFDLSGLSQATLECWLWFDIEEDFDYAYIEVSTDGGKTWDTLSGRYTTTTNPNGNNFGNGYTGKSGAISDQQPAWLKETIDLTPYVGGEILLCFEYVTDDAYNASGFCVDDIAIPELGYTDDVEGHSGWVAEGFIRSDNSVPQRFIVQLIKFRERTSIERMSLDGNQQGRSVIEGFGDEVQRAVLVITALAPVTTELAHYRYSIEPLGGR